MVSNFIKISKIFDFSLTVRSTRPRLILLKSENSIAYNILYANFYILYRHIRCYIRKPIQSTVSWIPLASA